MAKKKASINKWHVISDEFMKNNLSIVTDVNVKYFFDNTNTIFVVISKEIESTKRVYNVLANQFSPRKQMIAGDMIVFNHINDSKFISNNVKIFTTESVDSYKDSMDDMKSLIKMYMKSKSLYATIVKINNSEN